MAEAHRLAAADNDVSAAGGDTSEAVATLERGAPCTWTRDAARSARDGFQRAVPAMLLHRPSTWRDACHRASAGLAALTCASRRGVLSAFGRSGARLRHGGVWGDVEPLGHLASATGTSVSSVASWGRLDVWRRVEFRANRTWHAFHMHPRNRDGDIARLWAEHHAVAVCDPLRHQRLACSGRGLPLRPSRWLCAPLLACLFCSASAGSGGAPSPF